jgi:Tfp pilus assembly protein PilX
MPAIRAREKGVALFVILAVVFVAVALAGTILNLMLSQTRLTHHQVSRIQAFYAAQAGMNYAFNRMRRDGCASYPCVWTICRSGCTQEEPGLPAAVNNVTITVYPKGGTIDGINNVTITANYLYAAP